MIAAFFQLFDGLQTVATGALRGAGDTHTAMICHLLAYWGLGLPLGYYLCFSRGWGANGLWIGLALALIVIGLILVLAWRRKTAGWGERIAAGLPQAE
jgi:MATE family multidrug resistance protein